MRFPVISLGSRQIIRVRPGLEDVHHVADAVAACVRGRGAPGYKAFLPVLFLQVHDATARSECKFRITLVLDDRTQVVNNNVVDHGRAGKELLQVTLAAPLRPGRLWDGLVVYSYGVSLR